MDEIDNGNGPQPALRIRDLRSGWPFWLELAVFCDLTGDPMEALSQTLILLDWMDSAHLPGFEHLAADSIIGKNQ
ncbi:hypothetical protein [Rhizobium sp. BE258]|uniref:hypothetical protein n=1 Tax=Rhizobium sp. BE258 TaxID=2817722 RepID=UPI00285EC3E5|nr:hypothetical protein [Rhizobium sp. BE258]MDR7144733.1 hypothetical protein [Rhizobium sp. BE258]